MFSAFNKKEWEYYDIFHKDKDYEVEAKRLPLKGKTVLEIGSGSGLMTRELEKLGYEVTTVDPNYPADYNWIGAAVAESPDRFDNIIALYDVINYMPPWEYRAFKLVSRYTPTIIEKWNPGQGVKPFTHKRVGNYHRVRLGIKLFNKAHLLFIYWGKGLCLACHKLYLHGENS